MRFDFTPWSSIFCFGILLLPLWKILSVSGFNRNMCEISLLRSRSRPKKDASPDSIPILLLILSWIYPGRGPISLPSRSYFYPDSTLDLVPAFSLSLSLFYRGCVPIPMLSWFYPRSGQKENLVSLQVPDAFWQSLDNDFSSVLEKYLWHMSCDNMTFGRNLGGT